MSVEAWKSLFDIAAVVLLGLTFVAGAGVLLTGNIINKRQEEKLRKFDGDLTAAKSDLAKQQERAAKAESSIALAEQHSAEANAKAEGFRLEIARANAASAQANEIAERERLARLKLEASLSPRRLTGMQIEQLVSSLKRSPVGSIVIVSALLDVESSDFADDFDKAFIGAGWKTWRYKNRSTEETGLKIGTVSGTFDGGEAKEIGNLIASVGVRVEPVSFRLDDQSTAPNFEKGVLYFVVDHKAALQTSAASPK